MGRTLNEVTAIFLHSRINAASCGGTLNRSRCFYCAIIFLMNIPLAAAQIGVMTSPITPEPVAPMSSTIETVASDQLLPTVGAVGMGGALGAMSRYSVNQIAARWLGTNYPYGTLFVNVIGSFGVGLVNGWIMHVGSIMAPWDNLIIAGFFGGFTTFSAFANDTTKLLKAGEMTTASWYIAGSVGLSLIALTAGELLVPLLAF